VTYNAVSSEPFKQALKHIQKLPNFAYSVCQRELNPTDLVTLRMEKSPVAETRQAAPAACCSTNQGSVTSNTPGQSTLGQQRTQSRAGPVAKDLPPDELAAVHNALYNKIHIQECRIIPSAV